MCISYSEYSIRDGIIRINDLVKYVKELGMSACAITDHGNLSAAIEFYKTAKKEGIKSLLGCEIYFTLDEDNIENEQKTRDNLHVILIAENITGWRNLLWLVSNAAINNFYHKPRVSYRNLLAKSEGLIMSSACLKGIPSIFSQFNDKTLLDRILMQLKERFKDRLYLEVQDLPFKEQQEYNILIKELSKKYKLPVVITTDAHFLKPEDYDLHQLIVRNFSIQDAYNKENCIRTIDEMYESSQKLGIEEAFWNTNEIANRCNVEIELGNFQTPLFDIEKCKDYDDFLKWEREKYNESS